MNTNFYEFITWIYLLFLNNYRFKNNNKIFFDEENLIDNKHSIFYKIKND